MVLLRFVVLVFLSLPSLRASGAESLANYCNSPVKPGLTADNLANAIRFKNDIQSHALGKQVQVLLPTLLAKRSGATTIACIRWKPEQSDSDLNAALVSALEATAMHVGDLKKAADKTLASTAPAGQADNDPATQLKTAVAELSKAVDEMQKAANNPETPNKSNQLSAKVDTLTRAMSETQTLAASIAQTRLAGITDLQKALNKVEAAISETQQKSAAIVRNLSGWARQLPLRTLGLADDVTTIGVQFPDAIKSGDPTKQFWNRPDAELRILSIDANGTVSLDEILGIEIASPGFALLVAVGALVGLWWLCYWIAGLRSIPGVGPKRSLLRIIVNPYGYLSLSQLQTMLWTFVVGCSAIYVMVLTRRLIDVEVTMLALLGVAGVANIVAATKPTGGPPAAPAQSAQANPAPSAPGGVIDPKVCGRPGATRVVLAWKPPVSGGEADHYEIDYMLSGTAPPVWISAIDRAGEAPVTIGGLSPGSDYDFRIRAVNAAGSSSKTLERIITGASDGPAPQSVQPAVANILSKSVTIRWNAPITPADSYLLRYRETGTGLWLLAGLTDGAAIQFQISGLKPNTAYDFEIFGVTAGEKGPASATVSAQTAWRHPELADLLIAEDDKEIDVSRVQMLFFTIIAAVFVLLKVGSSHEIPVIPEGILWLMGLSNGVYLSAKFVPQKR